ncbi:hypothetical protein ALC62_13206 [Cyphomyrmex costatus]|uniref:Uncharacterized protein n=1 Tax=Cyphomyrmex costatus TaxID=456900 RepID=A0A195C696_9HYME|nr:hypothetical protein ALC62_13206 [Cyphomyrmex costatus]
MGIQVDWMLEVLTLIPEKKRTWHNMVEELVLGIHVKAGRRGTPRAALQAQRSMHPRSSPFAVAAAVITAAATVDELVTFCAILDINPR